MAFNRRRRPPTEAAVASHPGRQRARQPQTSKLEGPQMELALAPGDLASGQSGLLSMVDDDGMLNTAGPAETGAVARLELDAGIEGPGLRLYKASGVLSVNLDALTGNAFFSGTITAGSIRMNDSVANATYVWIADLDGLRWRRQSDDKNVSFVSGGYGGPSSDDVATSAEVNAQEITGGSDGASQGREARIYILNSRRRSDPGNNAVAQNKAEINLYTRWKTASTLAQITLASVTDTVSRFTVISDQTLIGGRPVPSSVGLSRHTEGTLYYGEQPGNVSFTTVQTDIVGGATITAIQGRRYKITCGWPRMATSDAGGAVVEMRIAEAGVGVLKQYRYHLDSGANVADSGDTISAVVSPSAGSHTYKLAGIRTSGAGTITVAGGPGAVPDPDNQWILVEDIGF